MKNYGDLGGCQPYSLIVKYVKLINPCQMTPEIAAPKPCTHSP